jgi:hypothetical protein
MKNRKEYATVLRVHSLVEHQNNLFSPLLPTAWKRWRHHLNDTRNDGPHTITFIEVRYINAQGKT